MRQEIAYYEGLAAQLAGVAVAGLLSLEWHVSRADELTLAVVGMSACLGAVVLARIVRIATASGPSSSRPERAKNSRETSVSCTGNTCSLIPASARTRSARPSVSSSAYSRSLPTGTPMAMRVTRTPSGLSSRAR